MDPNNSDIIWTGGLTATNIYNISKTTNNGASWVRDTIGTAAGYMYTMKIDPTNTNVVYAAGHESYSAAVFKTTDGGANWNKLAAAGLNGWVRTLAIDPTNSNTVFAGTLNGTANGVYRSTDGGNSWANTGFTGGATTALIFDSSSLTEANVIYAGTATNGVYYSTNNGGMWTQMNDGLDDPYVACLGINAVNGYLFAGTTCGSFYRESTIVAVEEITRNQDFSRDPLFGISVPISSRLNYSFEQYQNGRVSIAVYDIQGKLVRQLVDGAYQAGVYCRTWSCVDDRNRRVAAGIYFIKFENEATSDIHKLLVIY